MNKKTKIRTSIIALLILIIGVVSYFVVRSFVFSRLEKTIIDQLEALGLDGIIVRYDSLKTDSWKNKLVIKGLDVKFNGKDSLCFTGATIHEVEINGIALLPLLLQHELHLDAVFLDGPAIHAMNNFKIPGPKDQGKKVKMNFLKSIRIGRLRIDSGAVEVIDSTSCKSIAHLHMDVSSRNLSAHFLKVGSPKWAIAEVILSGVKADFPTHFYKLTVKNIFYSSQEKLLKLDSAQLMPLYNRKEFARRASQQIDQFSCTIPGIQATGFEIGNSQPSYKAHRVDLRFRLEAFRDKRIPRKTRKPSVLPVRYLQQLAFQLQIDTLAISDSYASYEEFPETGDAPGKVFFNGLHGGISNISNTSSQGATMNVYARLMNAGDLNASFTFPVEAQNASAVKGTLSNFSMPEINAILVPVAHTKIESGKIQEMKFHFQYNEFRSDGEVELSYTNLKVIRFKKHQEKLENKFMSFLLNMYVKNDLDKSDSKEKRTGSVQFVRNDQRGIFNYWWKSVFSGVKSVFIEKGNGPRKQKSTLPLAG